jgi:hypothetical protein
MNYIGLGKSIFTKSCWTNSQLFKIVKEPEGNILPKQPSLRTLGEIIKGSGDCLWELRLRAP